jgi:[protein-PII] uridylyltransferase
LKGRRFCDAYTALADRWLTGLLGEQSGVALVAVGGYGRRELCPGSDLDVLLLHSGRRDVAAVADRIWYPVWDAGVPLDHSVRTVKEAMAVADKDLKVALGLLTARWIAGDRALAADLSRRADALWHARGRRWAGELDELVRMRHEHFGDVPFLLEPELKESRGGIRDVHVLGALSRAAPFAMRSEAVAAALDALLEVRVELHRASGKATDRLSLQDQDLIAGVLGIDADVLMGRVAAAGQTIAIVGDDAWRRVRSWIAGPRGRDAAYDRPLGPGLVRRDGEVVITASFDVSADPTVILRTAEAAATLETTVAATTIERLVAAAPVVGALWPDSARSALVGLLGTGAAAIPVLELFDHHGLVERVLPEWRAVRSKPQRNSYHRFTVDRHLLETAAAAAPLTRNVHRPDLLLVGALLHDIGKGFPGDHTEAGVALVRAIATRMGFDAADVATLAATVRHHLLLPDVATRRDLDDPSTISAVASAVGNRDLLELLAALTEADSIATGATAWSPWKAGLVHGLVMRVAAQLDGEEPMVAPATFPTAEQRALMARRQVTVLGEGRRLTIVAPDRPGLVARVAGAVALNGLNVLAAQAATEDGMALQAYDVEPEIDAEPAWDRVCGDVERALAGRLAVEARLADRSSAYAGRRRPRAARPAEPRVLIDNDASRASTVVEVRAPDATNVLCRIARALADCDVDIHSAKVATLGHEVVDTFYVVGLDGAKITDPDHVREIEREILVGLGRSNGHP